jgi:uncharacterized membrane protein
MGKQARAKKEREIRKVPVSLPPLRTSPNWPVFALSVIGIALTSYLTWTHWTGNSVKGCTVGTSCDIVLYSRWAMLLGLPTSAWGLIAYASLAAAAFIKRVDRHWWCAWGVSFFGVLFSAYLTTVSLAVLHAACPYCLTSFALMTSIFALVTYQRPATLVNFAWRPWLSKTVPAAAAIIVLLHLHYSGILGEAPAPEQPETRALAINLAQSGAKMYGAYWCPHCQQQKSYFGGSADRLPYIECSPEGQNTPQSAECRAAGIQSYPTWVIKGKRIEEVLTPKQLADEIGFPWPTPASN